MDNLKIIPLSIPLILVMRSKVTTMLVPAIPHQETLIHLCYIPKAQYLSQLCNFTQPFVALTELVILGTGARIIPVHSDIKDYFKRKGIALEVQDTVSSSL